MGTEQFVLFYGGILSQWHPAKFKVDGVWYNCAEQYMMAEKARLFNDDDRLAMIMTTADPSVQKALGRKVVGFDKVKWDQEAKLIVYRANLAKFTQNGNLFLGLMGTDGMTIVEASPHDTVWGIGLGEKDPRATDRAQWRGTNWLGEILTKLREDLMGAWNPAQSLDP